MSYRILAIDPGTTALGVAVLDVDTTSDRLVVEHAATLDIAKYPDRYPFIVEIHGERVAKLHGVERALLKMLIAWEPDVLVCESPYMGRFPQAFAALVECLYSIRRALMQFDPSKTFNTIDPATIKNSVGVGGKNGDKTAMQRAVQTQTNLTLPDNYQTLDEHSVDAIAIGYAYYKSRC